MDVHYTSGSYPDSYDKLACSRGLRVMQKQNIWKDERDNRSVGVRDKALKVAMHESEVKGAKEITTINQIGSQIH